MTAQAAGQEQDEEPQPSYTRDKKHGYILDGTGAKIGRYRRNPSGGSAYLAWHRNPVTGIEVSLPGDFVTAGEAETAVIAVHEGRAEPAPRPGTGLELIPDGGSNDGDLYVIIPEDIKPKLPTTLDGWGKELRLRLKNTRESIINLGRYLDYAQTANRSRFGSMGQFYAWLEDETGLSEMDAARYRKISRSWIAHGELDETIRAGLPNTVDSLLSIARNPDRKNAVIEAIERGEITSTSTAKQVKAIVKPGAEPAVKKTWPGIIAHNLNTAVTEDSDDDRGHTDQLMEKFTEQDHREWDKADLEAIFAWMKYVHARHSQFRETPDGGKGPSNKFVTPATPDPDISEGEE